MSEVVYLIGAGASYGQRGIKKETGETLEGCIIRGLPIVNQLEPAIEWYCKTIQKKGSPTLIPKCLFIGFLFANLLVVNCF